jgi:hypothetical protein
VHERHTSLLNTVLPHCASEVIRSLVREIVTIHTGTMYEHARDCYNPCECQTEAGSVPCQHNVIQAPLRDGLCDIIRLIRVCRSTTTEV